MSDGSLDDIEAELEERVAAIHRYEPLYGVALIQLVVYRGMRSLFTRTELLADRIEAGPNANAIAKAIAPRLAGRLDTTATLVSISAAILLSAAAASVTDRVVSAGYEARLADTRSVIGSLSLADAEALARIVRLNPPIAAMIEHGVAIPHGRIKGLKSPVAAVLRLRRPIAFDAPDDEPVVLLVFLFVPEAATERHLEILAEIVEMLADPGLRERLKNEGDASALYRTIAAWQAPGAIAAGPSSS